eukprot:1823287-Lingulodinium_polyedra.AAC.1
MVQSVLHERGFRKPSEAVAAAEPEQPAVESEIRDRSHDVALSSEAQEGQDSIRTAGDIPDDV